MSHTYEPTLEGHQICSVAFNASGTRAAAGDSEGNLLNIDFTSSPTLYTRFNLVEEIRSYLRSTKKKGLTAFQAVSPQPIALLKYSPKPFSSGARPSSIPESFWPGSGVSPSHPTSVSRVYCQRNSLFSSSSRPMTSLASRTRPAQKPPTNIEEYLAVAISNFLVLFDGKVGTLMGPDHPVAVLTVHKFPLVSLAWVLGRQSLARTLTIGHLLSADPYVIHCWTSLNWSAPHMTFSLKEIGSPLCDVIPMSWPLTASALNRLKQMTPAVALKGKRLRALIVLLTEDSQISVWRFGEKYTQLANIQRHQLLKSLPETLNPLKSLTLHSTKLVSCRNHAVTILHPPFPYMIVFGSLRYTEQQVARRRGILWLLDYTAESELEIVETVIFSEPILSVACFNEQGLGSASLPYVKPRTPKSSVNLSYCMVVLQSGTVEIRSVQQLVTPLISTTFSGKSSVIYQRMNKQTGPSKRQVSSILSQTVLNNIVIDYQSKLLAVVGRNRGVMFYYLKSFLKYLKDIAQSSSTSALPRALSESQDSPAMLSHASDDDAIEPPFSLNQTIEDAATFEASQPPMTEIVQAKLAETAPHQYTDVDILLTVMEILEKSAITKITIPTNLAWMYCSRPVDYGWDAGLKKRSSKAVMNITNLLKRRQKNPLKDPELSLPLLRWADDFHKDGPKTPRRLFLEPALIAFSLVLRAEFLQSAPYRYPDTYRQDFWTVLLCLPQNSEAFRAYMHEIEAAGNHHPHYTSLEQRFPLQNETLLRRLKLLLSLLAYWWPESKQIDWLPQLVFGVAYLYGGQLHFCLEVLISMILWWANLACYYFNSLSYCLQSDMPPTDTENVDLASERDASCVRTKLESSLHGLIKSSLVPDQSDGPKTYCLQNECIMQDLNQWAWPLQATPGLPPVGLLMFFSKVLYQEDPRLWVQLTLHLGIISPHELKLCLRQYIEIYNAKEHQVLPSPRIGTMTSETPPIECKVPGLTALNQQLHVRFGSRILWPLVRSWLSEVLSAHHLATLWDHIFSNPLRPLLLPCAAVAFLRCHRVTLGAFKNYNEYFTWMTSARSVPMESLLVLTYKLDASLTCKYIREGLEATQFQSKLTQTVTLQDAGWPIWRMNEEQTSQEPLNEICYPQLLRFSESKPEALISVLRRRAKLQQLWSDKRQQLVQIIADSEAEPEVIRSKMHRLLDTLTLLLQNYQQSTVMDTLATNEHQLEKKFIQDQVHSSFSYDLEALELHLKLIEFYEECLNHMSFSQRPAKATDKEQGHQGVEKDPPKVFKLQDLARQLENDVRSLNEVLDSTPLSEEVVVQRRRILEEEARGLLTKLAGRSFPASDIISALKKSIKELKDVQPTPTSQSVVLSSASSPQEATLADWTIKGSATPPLSLSVSSKSVSDSPTASEKASSQSPESNHRRLSKSSTEAFPGPSPQMSSEGYSAQSSMTCIPSEERDALIKALAEGRRRYSRFQRQRRRQRYA